MSPCMADHLYWMARYMERAENIARMLDMQHQTRLLSPWLQGASSCDWDALLEICAVRAEYRTRHAELDGSQVIEFMVIDRNHPFSVATCLHAARENGHAVRGILTPEVWETLDQSWRQFKSQVADERWRTDPAGLFEWVKQRSHLSRGVVSGTLLQDEAYHFLRVGTFMERADNTARLLDMNFRGGQGLPETAHSPRHLFHSHDRGCWSAVLGSMSSREVYQRVYGEKLEPDKVLELLLLRADMPRSLHACLSELTRHLGRIANSQSAETLRRAGRLQSDLAFARIDEIRASGVHAYLSHFLERLSDLGMSIGRDLLQPLTS